MMKMMFHHTLVETNSISQGLSVRVTKVFRLLWKTVADVRCSALVNGIGGGWVLVSSSSLLGLAVWSEILTFGR